VQERVLFVERITYGETQGYVRTVLRNRDLYLALYGPGATVAEP
jgi:soluble lytic murein transglycosylase-like protein